MSFGLEVLDNSYTIVDHVKKIMRSLPTKWRFKVTTNQKAKNLNQLALEELLSSFCSHEIELNKDEPIRKSKSNALKTKGKKSTSKALQSKEKSKSKDGELDDQSNDLDDDELSLLKTCLTFVGQKESKETFSQERLQMYRESRDKMEMDLKHIICYK